MGHIYPQSKFGRGLFIKENLLNEYNIGSFIDALKLQKCLKYEVLYYKIENIDTLTH